MGIEVIKYLMGLLDLIGLYWGNLMFVSKGLWSNPIGWVVWVDRGNHWMDRMSFGKLIKDAKNTDRI